MPVLCYPLKLNIYNAILTASMESGRERTSCRCGAANCRGWIGSYSELPEEVKQRFAGFIADYLREDTE